MKFRFSPSVLTVLPLLFCLLLGCDDSESDEQTSTATAESSTDENSSEFKPTYREIVTGMTNTDRPEGWSVIDSSEEFGCNVAWPDSTELIRDCAAELEDGDLIFGFSMVDRNERHQNDFTLEAVANNFEAMMRLGPEKLLSETSRSGGTLIRIFGYRNDKQTVLAKLCVQDERFWLVNVVFANSMEDDPRIKFFFENFQRTR